MWLPTHVGFGGHSAADAAAKAALRLAAGTVPIPFSDFNASVNNYLRCKWQLVWEAQTNNKLRGIEPFFHGWVSFKLPRRDEIIIRKLRLGHMRANHSFLLKLKRFTHRVTVEHLLVACRALMPIREPYFNECTISTVFSHVPPRKIVDFIKAIGFTANGYTHRYSSQVIVNV
jgi:hypothetical protein